MYCALFLVLASLPLAFTTATDMFVHLIGVLCLPILLYGFYIAIRHVAITFYKSLDCAAPWTDNHIAVLHYPRHYCKHGRLKYLHRYPEIHARHLRMAIYLLLFGTSVHTLPISQQARLRHTPWASPAPSPFELKYYDIQNCLDSPWDPSRIMRSLPRQSPPLANDDWDSPSPTPFKLDTVDINTIIFPEDYDPSAIVKMLQFNLKSRKLKKSEAPLYFSLLDNPSCYSNITAEPREPPIIVDTGASTAITPKRSDFITYRESFMTIRDLSSSNTVHGEGLIKWDVVDVNGEDTSIIVEGCHIPKAEVRLLSPQNILERAGGYTLQTTEKIRLTLGTGTIMDAFYCPRTKLPCLTLAKSTLSCVASFWKNTFSFAPLEVRAFTTALSDDNVNTSTAQKEAALIHQRLSHASFSWILPLMRNKKWLRDNESADSAFRSGPFLPCSTKAPSCDVRTLKCISCECAKAHRRTSHKRRSVSKHSQSTSDAGNKSLKHGHTVPGACISADHYLSPVEGRLYGTFGRERQGYTCGTLFVDHASGKIFNFPQFSTTTNETLRSKHSLERLALEEGITIRTYHADNGVFASDAFKLDCISSSQKLSFSGVGAHHQNGVAERNIKTISQWARANMIHAAFHWPEFATVKLWPQALDYAVWVFNRLPSVTTGLSPNEIWSQSRDYSNDLRRAHVFGSPVYVLDPKLQDGGKVPKWSPRARRGMFVGFSTQHSSLVPLILNVVTGKITPQFHVVFDDKFETVVSLPRGASLRDEWMDILRFDHDCFDDADSDPTTRLPPEFTQWFAGDSTTVDTDDAVSVSSHPRHQHRIMDLDDSIEVINADNAEYYPEGAANGPIPPLDDVSEGDDITLAPDGADTAHPPNADTDDLHPPALPANTRPTRNVGTWKDGPANIRKFPIDGEDYDFSFNVQHITDPPVSVISRRCIHIHHNLYHRRLRRQTFSIAPFTRTLGRLIVIASNIFIWILSTPTTLTTSLIRVSSNATSRRQNLRNTMTITPHMIWQ